MKDTKRSVRFSADFRPEDNHREQRRHERTITRCFLDYAMPSENTSAGPKTQARLDWKWVGI